MKVSTSHKITTAATFTLNEMEIRALDAIVSYGVEPFLRVFKQHLGKVYLEGYEKGVESLFESVKAVCRPAISEVDKARKLLAGEK